MDEDQTAEERTDSLSPSRLDNLLRGLGTKVLRRKFKEIYAKLNGGKEWTDGPESGEEFCRSKWGNGAYVKGNSLQQEMMKGGNIELWDISCLQSVIIQMLTPARNDKQEIINSKSWSKDPSDPKVIWDPQWKAQMSSIRQLTNIRNSVFHLPNETLSQEEFDEYWTEAVVAIRKLGATQDEIDKVSVINTHSAQQPHEGQGQAEVVSSKKRNEENPEESKPVEELQTKFEELELTFLVQGQPENEVRGLLNPENVNPVVVNKKNESKASSLMRRGDSDSKSRDWDKALKFYTQAIEIPDISEDLRRKIYINRSSAHLKILEVPKLPFNFDPSESVTKKASKSNGQKLLGQNPAITSKRDPKFVDEKLLEMDRPKWPEKLTRELREIHITAGLADAKAALQLSHGQKCPTALYRIAQFHQLKGDWNSALTYFDLALGQSGLDSQLESDRGVCQLQLLNQEEVEEFNWIPGKKNQTMAGLPILRNTKEFGEIMDNAANDPGQQQQVYSQVIRAHFLAQSLVWEDKTAEQEGARRSFDEVVKLYEGAGKGGFASGIYNLGLLLQEGHGVSQADFFGAVHFFKSAALVPITDKTPEWMKEGVLEAQYRLGLCYEFGLGVGKDEKKALHWYEMASLGDFARASRRLGDIYSQGRLGVSKDGNMAFFFWEHAANEGGDTVAQTSAALHMLLTPSVTWDEIAYSLYSFSSAIFHNFDSGTATMISAVLGRKRHLESTLATLLHKLSQTNSTNGENFLSKNEEREPDEVSWNISTFINHILRTIHLLELAQSPEFLQKLEAISNWRAQFMFTDRLVQASNCCMKGLAAVQELNKLYRAVVVESNGGQLEHEVDYLPDLREISGIDEATLAIEGHLVALILDYFANSIRLVGAVYLQDRLTQELIKSLVDKACSTRPAAGFAPTRQQMSNLHNSLLISCYILILKGVNLEELDQVFGPATVNSIKEPFVAISTAAVQGSLGKFDVAAGHLDLQQPDLFSKCDLLFVQALCCKSAALTRGVNTANRKKVKEAMGIFQKFLSICPKDEPRRAEAHYQLGLCTLYLEKMKVKGQVKGQSPVSSSTAQDILDKVLPHFTHGEMVEQEFPWKELQCPDDFPVKLLLQREIQELENSIRKIPVQNRTPGCEGKLKQSKSSWFGTLMDPFFKFPASSFPLKLRGPRRIEVITQYRKFFKAAMDLGLGSSSYSAWSLSTQMEELKQMYFLPGNPFSAEDLCCRSTLVGCYEIVEPVLHSWIPTSNRCKAHEVRNLIMAFTMVQDESGAVFYVQLVIKLRGDEGEDKVGEIGEFRMGARIIINRPGIRLHADGGTSIMVNDVDTHVFHLPPPSKQQQQQQENGDEDSEVTRKCGYCGKTGGNLEQCAKCTVVYYCGKDCQTADWKDLKHKWICPFLHPSFSPPSPVQDIRRY